LTRARTQIGLLAASVAAALGACAAPGPGPDRLRSLGDQAEIVVEVYSGLLASNEPAPTQQHVHFLVDVTPLMTSDGPLDADSQLTLARKLTAPYLQDRTLDPAPEFHAFNRMLEGQAQGSCPDTAGAELYASEAIEKLRTELASREEPGSRIVLFTSFKNECQPRLCEVAEQLVQRGSWLDTVVVGAEASTAPQCLRALRPSVRQPDAWLASWTPPAPGFSVSAVTEADPGQGGSELATGKAGGSVLVSPGLRTIRVLLDPPELIGPLRVRPGDRLRVRVMNFPLSAPEGRTWIVEPINER
jgi:hypothetical protein